MKDRGPKTVTAWASQLKEELEKRTGRKDIDVTVSPYCSYDSLISAAADGHPIIDFYSQIQGDPQRLANALDYAVSMIENWEATTVLHEKAKKDCLPFYERLQREFPHLKLLYQVFDFDTHYLRLEKVDDKMVASFDLWPKMTDSDIERIASYIKDFEATLHRENATWAGITYSWK